MGGDETTAIDAAAEGVVLARFDGLDGVTIVSEEAGMLGNGRDVCRRRSDRRFAEREAWDQILLALHRGRVRSRRWATSTSASSTTSARARSGPRSAARGPGSTVQLLESEPPRERIEILAFEATRTSLVAEKAAAVVDLAYRLRIMGSLALSLCHLAAGRVDAVCSLKPARSVDIAAGQLLVRERGLAIDLFDAPPFEAAPLDVEGRSRVVAAGTPELCRQLASALSA